MLARNELFCWRSMDATFRLLHVNSVTDNAWIIDVGGGRARFPQLVSWSKLYQDFRSDAIVVVRGDQKEESVSPSNASVLAAQSALEAIRPLVFEPGGDKDLPRLRQDIFDATIRHQLICSASRETGVAVSTLYSYLRKWWIGGQTRNALVPLYRRRGSRSFLDAVNPKRRRNRRRAQSAGNVDVDLKSITGGRGRVGKHGNFGWTKAGLEDFTSYMERAVGRQSHRSLTKLFDDFLLEHHYYIDESGFRQTKPEGERPSERQMYYAYQKLITKDRRLKNRVGEQEYDKNHAPKDGSTQDVCDGIGHMYEIDATIIDLFVRSSKSRDRVAGRPTLVLVVDRRSFLIVGFYLGFERDCWAASREAILSILEDKQQLCERNGVQYDPKDWPATGILPQLFVADRGPMAGQQSSILCGPDLQVGVENLPAGMAKFKPHVECLFKLSHIRLASEPGYIPPPSKRRVGKKYELDSALTLKECGTKILQWIIDHNRKPGSAKRLALEQLDRRIDASPIRIWEDETYHRIGQLERVDESVGRAHLLQPKEATVSRSGINVDDLYYTCPTAIREAWFDSTHSVQSVMVRADKRLCDEVYVEVPIGRGEVRQEVATLTGDSKQFAGLSWGEVAQFLKLREAATEQGRTIRKRIDQTSRQRHAPMVASAQAATRRATRGKSGASQTNGEAESRAEELRAERRERILTTRDDMPGATVYDIKSGAAVTAEPTSVSPLQQALMKVQEEMTHDPLSP